MGLMHAITRRPLSTFVDFLWISEGYVQPHAAERILPSATLGLVLSLDENSGTPGVLSGARTRSFVLDTSKPLSLMGVAFRPGGGFPFFAGPAGELQDLNVDLDTLWGHEARTLHERLLEARTAPARFRILEDFLLARVLRAPGRHAAVRFALDAFRSNPGELSVGAVTARTGLSARRFIELFRNEVGVAPKVYCRLSRFRAVLGAVASVPTVDWSATASACGYFDQSHFIHEFREFAGMTPTAYLRHRTQKLNHVRQPV